MKRLRFLLLDANVVIKLFEFGLWSKAIEKCEFWIAETVIGETEFFFNAEGQNAIDLSADIAAGRVTKFVVPADQIAKFQDQFRPDYLDRIDPGEAESLAYLMTSTDACLLCSGDSIVFRILGRMGRGEQGISLEEVLQQIGFTAAISSQYRRDFRDRWTKRGQQDMVQTIGLK